MMRVKTRRPAYKLRPAAWYDLPGYQVMLSGKRYVMEINDPITVLRVQARR